MRAEIEERTAFYKFAIKNWLEEQQICAVILVVISEQENAIGSAGDKLVIITIIIGFVITNIEYLLDI